MHAVVQREHAEQGEIADHTPRRRRRARRRSERHEMEVGTAGEGAKEERAAEPGKHRVRRCRERHVGTGQSGRSRYYRS